MVRLRNAPRLKREKLNKEVTKMAFVITSDCITCGACADTCPASAINMGDSQYEIDQDACLQCGACVDSCPTGAIVEK